MKLLYVGVVSINFFLLFKDTILYSIVGVRYIAHIAYEYRVISLGNQRSDSSCTVEFV